MSLPFIPTYITPETILQYDTNEQYQIIHHTNQQDIHEDAKISSLVHQNI
jgi:hypothetical protein